MAAEKYLYDTWFRIQWKGIDLSSDTIKACLLTSSYTFDASHQDLATVLGSPSCEVEQVDSPDNGYTTGGETLTGCSVTYETSPQKTIFDADDVEWAALTATFRYAVYYIEGTIDGITNPVLSCVLLDNTPADIVQSGTAYKLEHNASGIMDSSEA